MNYDSLRVSKTGMSKVIDGIHKKFNVVMTKKQLLSEVDLVWRYWRKRNAKAKLFEKKWNKYKRT